MKKVIFGDTGGFPLEQETLIQLQDAYSKDMLDALMAHWGVDPTQSYWVARPTASRDGFMITTIPQTGKLDLVRVLNTDSQSGRIKIEDARTDGQATLTFGNGSEHKVYEEFIAFIVSDSNAPYDLELGQEDVLPIDKKYLPIDGSRPLDGTLTINQDLLTLGNATIDGTLSLPNITELNSQVPLVLGNSGTIGYGVPFEGGGDANFTPGMIMMWGGTVAPTGWAICDGNNGQAINGITIPDLRSRFVVGHDSRDADYNQIHNTGGEKEVTLTTSQMPSHNHSGYTNFDGSHNHRAKDGAGGQNTNSIRGNNNSPNFSGQDYATNWVSDSRLIESAGNHRHSFTTSNTGGGQPHENRPPYYVLTFIIFIGEGVTQNVAPVITNFEMIDNNNNPVVNIDFLNLPLDFFPVRFDATASDADGDPLQYRFVISKPSGATEIRGYESLSEAEFGNRVFNENGPYTATVFVTDGFQEVIQDLTFEVSGIRTLISEVALGDCSDTPRSWTQVYVSGNEIQAGNVIYTDISESTPFNGNNQTFRYRVGGELILNQIFDISQTGVISRVLSCEIGQSPSIQVLSENEDICTSCMTVEVTVPSGETANVSINKVGFAPYSGSIDSSCLDVADQYIDANIAETITQTKIYSFGLYADTGGNGNRQVTSITLNVAGVGSVTLTREHGFPISFC